MSARPYVWASVLLALTLALGIAVNMGLTRDLDLSALRVLALRQGRGNDGAIVAFQWVSWAGEAGQRSILAVASAAWLLWRKRPRTALVMLVMPPLTGATSSILKEMFARPRPSVVPHLDTISNLSYPSGHASGMMAVFMLMALLLPGQRHGVAIAGAVALAVLIGWSRMMLGVHWPSDLIGGWLWGLGFALAGAALAKRFEGSAPWQADRQALS